MTRGLFNICSPKSRIRRYFDNEDDAERVLARMVCEAKGISPIRDVDLRRVTLFEMRRIRIGKTRADRARRGA